MMFLRVKMQQIRCCRSNYKGKGKTAEISYLEAKKEQTKYDLIYLEVSKKEERHDSCFEGQRTARNLNLMFLAVINKEIKGASCIQSGNYNKIAIVPAFSS